MSLMQHPSRDQIFLSAFKVFAQKGYEGATLADVAQAAGVSLRELEEDFSSKEQVFRLAFRFFMDERMEIVDRTLIPPRTKEEFIDRIRLFVEEMIAAHMENPYTYQIIHQETERDNPLVAELYRETMLQVVFSVVSFFEVAKNLEYLRADLEPRLIARILLPLIEDVDRKEKVVHSYYKRTINDEDYRQRLSRHIIEIFVKGIIS